MTGCVINAKNPIQQLLICAGNVGRGVGGLWGDAKTIHGRETHQKRADTSSKLADLHELEVMARAAGSTICRGVQYTHD